MNKYTNKNKYLNILNKFMISLICYIFMINISMGYSQDKTVTIQDKAIPVAQNSEIVNKIDGTPVLLGNTTLFVIQKNVGSFSHQERAQAVTNRLEKIANDPLISMDKLRVVEDSDTTNIVIGDKTLFTITDKDAKAVNKTRQILAEKCIEIIRNAINQYRKERSLYNILKGLFYTFISTVILFVFLKVFNQVYPRIITKLQNWRGIRIPELRIQNIELLPTARVSNIVTRLVKIICIIIVISILYIYISLVLSFFPWTKQISSRLISYFLGAIYKSWLAFADYLPNIFALALIFFITHYSLKFIRYIFTELGNGNISISGFYNDWAEPTYKLVFLIIVALALVLAFPYLPGFGSPAFQGISVFLGVLFSLGSTAVITNVVAGTILIYTRAFQIGDRIKIGDAIGDIVEKTLLVTRIRTIKNVIITIPNGTVLTSQIINYSSLSQDPNYYLILNTTITLGYDVPWRKVHQVLIDAAIATNNILPEPVPFVFQTSLDDFYVSYELNAYTNKPILMASIYSELHQNIQDKCNEAEIEILSPHYSAVRDGNQTTIPENYLPQDYKSPGFRLSYLNNLFNPDNSKNTPDS
ncbi:mechanosensitive ion channel family protein [Aphanizomenon flos-aquae FACHB-1416]|uniref:Mechanosensitive ion channel family protein n=3 Tax=Aphanizomenonaceae TaxID=1892259 RepID=A0ABR8IR00_APHFL|nr:mechanosensitive ion channel family protein [Aphanizomenon flos-aquae FACHB-1171]MBD2558578.1 mechanosensitive ion channel family protein [Aphanizomenon flos-aquae FACHB-1290]MBD2630975.1 mechanosensitive ion channel family protein [Aphanizomenon sp. FACHB-1399]MBD2642388.1 mechanosensitive ion channel family protein [Aphanizomenon sp. FACHB-1401]MBD2658222.1 mechanosensitive ion channel family protein [Aphanizomenon flos-aquae FACHB-1265]MBD2674007.1 mechanosensitive ion channel family pro